MTQTVNLNPANCPKTVSDINSLLKNAIGRKFIWPKSAPGRKLVLENYTKEFVRQCFQPKEKIQTTAFGRVSQFGRKTQASRFGGKPKQIDLAENQDRFDWPRNSTTSQKANSPDGRQLKRPTTQKAEHPLN